MADEQIELTAEEEAEALFTEYFVKNYPGPNTIIGNPLWHAPKIFGAAVHAMRSATSTPDAGEVLREADTLDSAINAEMLNRSKRYRDALKRLFDACKVHDPDNWAGEPAMIDAARVLGEPPFGNRK